MGSAFYEEKTAKLPKYPLFCLSITDKNKGAVAITCDCPTKSGFADEIRNFYHLNSQ